MGNKKTPVEFPDAFLDFWENADRETRMMAACIGYAHALKTLDEFLSCLISGDE